MGRPSNLARRPAAALTPETRRYLKLGRYEVVRELGKGAMGIVYLAKDPLIGRLVALKTIRLGAHADDDEMKEFQQRFIREAQAAGILNHPSIVTVHDIGQRRGDRHARSSPWSTWRATTSKRCCRRGGR